MTVTYHMSNMKEQTRPHQHNQKHPVFDPVCHTKTKWQAVVFSVKKNYKKKKDKPAENHK